MAKRVASWTCEALEKALLAADVPVLAVASPAEMLASAAVAQRGLRTQGSDGPLIRFPVRLKGMDGVHLSMQPRDWIADQIPQ
jgi:crotonobetainyl-CoA:carnitine CoA-transferase CaiB-like acyl-CoA transferase